ncbi:hypothetical protein V2O64_15985 [Verrucomicrobiaceae bacterium 227]
MKSSSLTFFLIAAASFTIGLFIPGPLGRSQSNPEILPQAATSRDVSGKLGPANREAIPLSASRRGFDPALQDNPQKLNLQVEVVEALIKAKGMARLLPQMRLTGSEVKTVLEIKEAAIKGLKDLEVKHATLRSGDEGDYYVIEAFPDDRDVWMAGMTRQLRDLVDDDRATVISRIIAQSDNDEETGLYHREIRTLKATVPGGDTKIKESVFDKNGHLIDEDYTIYRGEHESRWEHLFEPEAE